jgi:hypothetical protein
MDCVVALLLAMTSKSGALLTSDRHTPRMRVIQYAAASRFYH